MKFPFDAFILDTSFRPKKVKLIGKHGAEALQTAEGNVVQAYEVFASKEEALQKADAAIGAIQSLVFERRSRGG